VILAIWQSLAKEQQIHPIYILKNQNFLIFFGPKGKKICQKKITAKLFSFTKVHMLMNN
jgi:hypothetical protein